MILLLIFGITVVKCSQIPHLFSDEFIQIINDKQDLWKAGSNFPKETSVNHVKNLMGIIPDFNFDNLEAIGYINKVEAPEEFDAREKWPFCPSIHKVWDQGTCGSCWAVAATEIITDRVCVQSNGSRSFNASVEDLLTCCTDCRHNCSGGNPFKAWDYWIQSGIVSGGDYNSNIGCRPYEIRPCIFKSVDVPNCDIESELPSCKKTCIPNYNETYEEDKNYGKRYYQVEGENDIKMELATNGPVEALMIVYDDFFCYKSGIYKHVHGEKRGFHAVKIVGYGLEKGVKYWSAVNSWSSKWGDNGFFKIIRGEDDCYIESTVIAGEPLYN